MTPQDRRHSSAVYHFDRPPGRWPNLPKYSESDSWGQSCRRIFGANLADFFGVIQLTILGGSNLIQMQLMYGNFEGLDLIIPDLGILRDGGPKFFLAFFGDWWFVLICGPGEDRPQRSCERPLTWRRNGNLRTDFQQTKTTNNSCEKELKWTI